MATAHERYLINNRHVAHGAADNELDGQRPVLRSWLGATRIKAVHIAELSGGRRQ